LDDLGLSWDKKNSRLGLWWYVQ